MKTKTDNEIFAERNNPHIQAINAARSEARELLMALLQEAGHYAHPVYAERRKAYLNAVQRFADLCDIEFDAAVRDLL
jgi:hypothetical protein